MVVRSVSFIFVCLALVLFSSCAEQHSHPYQDLTLASFSDMRKTAFELSSRDMRRLLGKMAVADKGKTIADGVTRDYYSAANPLLWVDRKGVDSRADTLVSWLQKLSQAGISDNYFSIPAIERDLRTLRTLDTINESLSVVLARVEYLMTKAYLRYAVNQQYGFCNPDDLLNHFDVRDSDSVSVTYNRVFDIPIRHPGISVVNSALRKLANDSVAEYLREVQPHNDLYARLEKAFAETTDAQKRKRLLVNMERCRWRLRSYPQDQKRYVMVNLPSFHLRAVCPDSTLEMRIGCGTSKTKTPLLTSRIHRMDINPQWVMPRSIVEKDVVRHVGDSSWFARHHYFVMDRRKGKRIEGHRASWTMLHDKRYSVIQEGGKGNSLGRIIFRFDNDFSVFIHDTSTPGFFVRDNRSVSHGCVRVQRPYELALFMLGKKAGKYAEDLLYNMTGDSIEDKSRHLGTLNVEPQVPLYITYYTVYPTVEGNLQYLPDIYGYDKHIYQHLAETCLKKI